MNPAYGIVLWIIIGAAAGWVAGLLLGHTDRQRSLVNMVVGIVGAVVGGYLAQNVLGEDLAHNGLIASFAVALLGSCLVIALWMLLSRLRTRLAP